MNMSLRTKITVAVVYSLTLVALGYYLVPVKVKTEIKTVEVEKVVYKDKETSEDTTHKVIKQHKEKHKDGSVTTDTVVSFDNDKKDTKNRDDLVSDNKSTDTVKEIVRGSSPVVVSALVGVNVTNGQVSYGGSVQKNILGPINTGLWGLSNGIIGTSVGLSF